MGYKMIGCGSYLPKKIITNKDLTLTLDTSEEWIESRTGIKHRHIANEQETTSYMAYQAAEQAIKDAKIDKGTIDMIIVATTTPDNTFPATATKVQNYLGLSGSPAFDIQAVCAGFLYGLHLVRSLMQNKAAKTILLVGAEKMSSIINWKDRSTAILFGDGASAMLFSADHSNDFGIIDSEIYSDGQYYDILYTDGGVALNQEAGYIIMKGREVYKNAIEKMGEAITFLLKRNNISVDTINHFIPHQANIRIIDSLAEKLGLSLDKVVKTVDKHANCSAASIPLALEHAKAQGRLKRGDLILTSAIGGGIAWGAALIKY